MARGLGGSFEDIYIYIISSFLISLCINCRLQYPLKSLITKSESSSCCFVGAHMEQEPATFSGNLSDLKARAGGWKQKQKVSQSVFSFHGLWRGYTSRKWSEEPEPGIENGSLLSRVLTGSSLLCLSPSLSTHV